MVSSRHREHITEGFDNMVEAFQGLFTRENTKAIVKVWEMGKVFRFCIKTKTRYSENILNLTKLYLT